MWNTKIHWACLLTKKHKTNNFPANFHMHMVSKQSKNYKRRLQKSTRKVCCPAAKVQTLLITNFNIKVSNTPFQSLLVRVEEYVKAISANNATSVENFYALTALVARDNHFGSKWIHLISGYKAVALGYFVATGCYAI